jgi:Protein of unknown function (DUF2975)
MSFTRLLKLACGAFEFLILLGLLLMLIVIPLAESAVASGSHVSISRTSKSSEFSYVVRLAHHQSVSMTNGDSLPQGQPEDDGGSVSVGPFALSADKGRHVLTGMTTDKDVEVQKVEGIVVFKGATKAVQALREFKWPAATGELCAILTGLAFFDLLRRLLAGAEKGELFTDAHVRMLRQIGFLMISLGLVRFAVNSILVARMNAYVAPYFAEGTWALGTSLAGTLSGAVSGASVLLLAEVFREGVKFRKDSDLTI